MAFVFSFSWLVNVICSVFAEKKMVLQRDYLFVGIDALLSSLALSAVTKLMPQTAEIITNNTPCISP